MQMYEVMEHDPNRIRSIRVAYFASTREYANEEQMQTEDGRDISSQHRGSLPDLARYFERYNEHDGVVYGNNPAIQMSLVVVDDTQPLRDYGDLWLPIHVEPSSCFTPKGMPGATKEERRAAKMAYERRILGILHVHQIDFIVSDRYMRIFEDVLLGEYLGLIINSHPARLPGLEGKTPTMDALKRARETSYCWHGNTAHIMDNLVDHGAPLAQEEMTHINLDTDALNPARLRRRNRERENPTLYAAIVGYLRDPQVLELIVMHRQLMNARGNDDLIMARMTKLRSEIIEGYRRLFEANLGIQRETPCEEGRYKYNAFLLRERLRRRELITQPQMMRAGHKG